MQAAIGELQRLIPQHDPEATSEVEPGDHSTGTCVLTTVDVEATNMERSGTYCIRLSVASMRCWPPSTQPEVLSALADGVEPRKLERETPS